MVGKAVGFGRKQSECSLSRLIGAALEQEIKGPLGYNPGYLEVFVPRGCISVCRGGPIVRREEVFGEHTRIA